MVYHVYMLKSLGKKSQTYVGYTNNLKNRIKLHNSGKGAKFTRGRKWILIYKEKINSKSEEVWRFYPQTGWEKAPTTRFYDGFIEIREEVMGLIIKTFMINRKTLTAEDGDGICEYSCKIITEKEMEAQEFLMMQEYTKEKDERLKGNQI